MPDRSIQHLPSIRNLPVHGGLGIVRCRPHTMAVDCRPSNAGPRRGHHDGPHHDDRRRDGSKGKDRWHHGAAWNDVCDRHRSRSIAWRHSGRRNQLAGNLPCQRTTGYPDFFSAANAHRRTAAFIPLKRRRKSISVYFRIGFSIAVIFRNRCYCCLPSSMS